MFSSFVNSGKKIYKYKYQKHGIQNCYQLTREKEENL